MKRILLACIAAVAAALGAPASAAGVGVSVSIGQPGFYGRIDIGGYPPPQVVYRRPVIIAPAPVAAEPIYLRVPPGHAKNWAKHCAAYGACGQRVYFVRDDWYQREVVPRYRSEHGDRGDRDDRRSPPNWDHRDERGPGRGHEHDRDHGRDRH